MVDSVADKRVVGVDVGGTKILAGVVTADGTVEHRRERPTELTSQDRLLEELGAAVEEVLDDSIAAVGFGLPSRIDQRAGRVDGSVNIPLADVPLQDLMTERLGLPVTIENDGNAAALAEHRAGAGRGTRTMVMLTLGTGVGGGVVIDGKLLRDGGELGHTVLVFDGIPCQGTCTGRGHLEAYVSGLAATKLAQEAFGPAVDAHRLVRLAGEDDSTAVEILDGIGRKLGAAIGSFVNIFRPELIVIGGGFAAAGDFLLAPARETMRREALPPADERVRIVRAELGTAAGVIGAALVAYDTFR
ncbi:MAG TPA: ROK family protein [Gaiellaceae bacterium]|nr:ROK family protein [Gaiellaceae bacterium]